MGTPSLNIDGQEVEFASLDSYTMDEAMVLWRYTEMTLDQVAEVDGFVPGVVAGLIHVSIQRANPQMAEKRIRAQVGAMKLSELEQVFENITEEADEVPPTIALATETASASSGAPSTDDGEPSLENTPEHGSGPGGSLTSLADFARVTSANSPPDSLTAFST